MFSHDMTLFSKYIENRETKYRKSYIKGVHWEDTKGVNVLKSGMTSADQSTVYIPLQGNKDLDIKAEDIIVKGLIDDDFTTVRDLEKKYRNTRIVTSVDTLDFGSPDMQHIRVGAK